MYQLNWALIGINLALLAKPLIVAEGFRKEREGIVAGPRVLLLTYQARKLLLPSQLIMVWAGVSRTPRNLRR